MQVVDRPCPIPGAGACHREIDDERPPTRILCQEPGRHLRGPSALTHRDKKLDQAKTDAMVGRKGGVELRQPIDGFTERARRLANVGEQDHRDAVGGRHEEQPTNECRRFPRIGQVAQIEARQPKQRVHMVGIERQRFAEHLGGRRMALEVLGNAPAQSQEGGVPKAKFMRLVEQPLGLVGVSALHQTLDEGGANGAFHRVLLQQVQQQRFRRGNPSGTPLGLGQQQRGRRGSLFEQPLGDLLRATGAARTVLSLARK